MNKINMGIRYTTERKGYTTVAMDTRDVCYDEEGDDIPLVISGPLFADPVLTPMERQVKEARDRNIQKERGSRLGAFKNALFGKSEQPHAQ
jgi:hypothetical protein